MSLLKSKYASLAPQVEYLCDEVVLAQAWKKSHAYISRYNWYADTLELDCSAVDLEGRLEEWRNSLSNGDYKPTPCWLVPAPKSMPWVFSSELPGGWGPKSQLRGDGVEQVAPLVLRPIAHLGIREQTIATAVMLCLADCVESAQGDPATSPNEASSKSVFSYGNRLYCHWENDGSRARFSWGNSDTYSRYFKDYQQFVARPNEIARKVDREKTAGELVYVVKLDLSAFFDNIDLDRLIRCLRHEYSEFRKSDRSLPKADAKFWSLSRQVINFSWRVEDSAHAGLFRGGILPNGLPQGLVASGFFANAYMLEFDRVVGKMSGDIRVPGNLFKIKVHDYCRYVDDIRLVISVRASETTNSEAAIAEAVSTWVQKKLDESTNCQARPSAKLLINPDKTELELYSSIGGESGVAARMKSLQKQLSGPVDMDILQQLESGLNGLLALAELGLKETSVVALTEAVPLLAAVARQKLEVRDDTLTRFSAYRLTKSLRMRRSMTDLAEVGDDGTAKELLLHDFEVTARRLVAAWAVNPSLVQVLRYALDLFPDPELLEVVTQALIRKLLLMQEGTAAEQAVVYYVFAELFKAGAMETGRRSTLDPGFVVGNVVKYRENLAVLAQTMLELDGVPWYVQQQASLLLASIEQRTESLSDGQEMRFHRALHGYFQGDTRGQNLSPMEEVSIALVGFKLQMRLTNFRKWFKRFSVGRESILLHDAMQLIGQTDPQLLRELIDPTNSGIGSDKDLLPQHLSQYMAARWPSSAEELPARTWISLARAIMHPRQIFEQENALLQLGMALTSLPSEALARPESLTPLQVEVRCKDWASLLNPRHAELEVRYVGGTERYDPIYATPGWCEPAYAWMYAFGRLLRAAATGEPDFTARHWLLREEPGWYSGIRSTWYKRRIGMMHTATALGGTTTAVTPWFTQLLLGLLKWPGTSNGSVQPDINSIQTPVELAKIFEERLSHQGILFGVSTNLPVYRFPVNWEVSETRMLRVVLVQGLMPAGKDFVGSGIAGLSDAEYRKRHRNHTAALLHLVHRKLLARNSVLGISAKPFVDLVIFPEYTVHVDDQDLMRAFSDATGAMLFYGLLGATVPGTSAPTNMARWLVPQHRGGRRSWVEVDQGKWHLTEEEIKLGVSSWRPYQVIIELSWNGEPAYRISGAICYDATDIALAADLKDETHMFIVAAMNKDVKTFDSMVSALRYHMYQHVLIANSGEFGGSTAQAPYAQEHQRLVSHVHGAQQIAVCIFDINIDDFGPALNAAKPGVKVTKGVTERIGKTRPAGLSRRH
jgi:hypothetical protein